MELWFVCVVTNVDADQFFPVLTTDPYQLIYDIKHMTNPMISIPPTMQRMIYATKHNSIDSAQRELHMFNLQSHSQKVQYISESNPSLSHILT